MSPPLVVVLAIPGQTGLPARVNPLLIGRKRILENFFPKHSPSPKKGSSVFMQEQKNRKSELSKHNKSKKVKGKYEHKY